MGNRLARGAAAAAVALAALATAVTTGPAAHAAAPRPGKPAPRIDHPRHGHDAVSAVGGQIDAVAAQNETTPAKLSGLLEGDQTAWLDQSGQAMFVEPTPTTAGSTADSTTTPPSGIPDANTFLLHSKPGSNRVIYLDFNGEVVSGTGWNDSYTSGVAFTAEPYDSDGNPSSFSAAELNVVKGVWLRVAEDYAPFDVDVTTEDPGLAAIDRTDSTDQVYGTRALITNTSTVYSSCSCGGIAYVGTFDSSANHQYYEPALVFERGLGSGAKNLAEAASHEVGHNLGLHHDGTSTAGYYSGQGAWAPIMGVGYYKPVTQWSKGEYTDANNTEDDFAVMAANGAALRADDFGDTAATGTTLSGPTAGVTGRITTRTDVDAFNITAGAGAATFTAKPVPTSPDLDVSLKVYDAGGTLVASADPAATYVNADSATGLDATITTTLAAGTYTVVVDGVGVGSPTVDGYSDYASLGVYTLSASVAAAAPNNPPTAAMTPTSASGTAPLAVSFSGAGSTDSDGTIAAYAWAFGDGTSATGATTSHTWSSAGTYTVTLTVTDNGGATASTTVTVTVTAPTVTAPAAPTGAGATLSGAQVVVTWVDNATNETGYQIVREKLAPNGKWGGATLVATTGANATRYTDSPGSGTWRYRVRAVNSAGASAEAVTGSVTVKTSKVR